MRSDLRFMTGPRNYNSLLVEPVMDLAVSTALRPVILNLPLGLEPSLGLGTITSNQPPSTGSVTRRRRHINSVGLGLRPPDPCHFHVPDYASRAGIGSSHDFQGPCRCTAWVIGTCLSLGLPGYYSVFRVLLFQTVGMSRCSRT